jgi:hypothetical protein
VLLTHTACAWKTVVVHGVQLEPQAVAVLVVSTHVPLQLVVVPEQDAAHAYVPPGPAQTGVPASALQRCPHAPQLVTVVSETHAPPQKLYPLLHVKLHALETQAAVALATMVVHRVPHRPQL